MSKKRSFLSTMKNIATSIVSEAGVEVVRGYVIERMKPVKPADLYKAIKDGTHTMSVTENKDRNMGRKWSKLIEKYHIGEKKISRNMLTAENVLEWLNMDRPDLGSLVINMGDTGMNWLKEDVKEIYKFLFGEPATPSQIQVKRVKQSLSLEEALGINGKPTDKVETPNASN